MVIKLLSLLLFSLLGAGTIMPQNTSTRNETRITYLAGDLQLANLDDAAWNRTDLTITTYWSSALAPKHRHFKVRMLWSDTAVYVRFEANQSEPLVVGGRPDITKKTRGLWDRDVCEIFIAPDRNNPNKYFEFEVAPTGEWIDLGIEVTPKGRLTDWEYRSGMEAAARIDKNKVVMAIKIPFAALGRTPKAGDVWLGNLFRCVGKDPARGYLAWRPTKTKTPNFHVPAAFGEFRFVR